MGKAAKIVLAVGGTFLVCAVMVQVGLRLGGREATRAFLSQQDRRSQEPSGMGRVISQPTIVEARPETADGAVGSPANPRYSEPAPPSMRSREGLSSDAMSLPLGPPTPGLGERSMGSLRGIDGLLPRLDTIFSQSGNDDALEVQSDTSLFDPFDQPVNAEQPMRPDAESFRPSPAAKRISTRPNDSFWEISQRLYGTPAYFKALYVHNRSRIASPDRIEAGVEILAPELSELRRLYPTLCPDEAPAAVAGPRR